MIVLQTALFLFESFFCSCFGLSCTDDVDVFWAFHRIYHDDYEISGDIRRLIESFSKEEVDSEFDEDEAAISGIIEDMPE